MKIMNNFLSLMGIILLMTTLMATSCHKEPIVPTTGTKPSIESVSVSTTMNSATINVVAKNYSSMTATIDGGSPVNVIGATYTVNSLSANKSYVVVITATNSDGSTSYSQSFTTAKSSLTITSFEAKDMTSKGATFTFSVKSDATIISQTLVNDSTSEAIDVTSKNSYTIDNLAPSTLWKFTLKVKDDTGNEVSGKINFYTLAKPSEAISITEVSYGDQFAIMGNAVSSKLVIKVNNSSSSARTVNYFAATFGDNGKAVKMLRHSLNGSAWKVVPQIEKNVLLQDLTFQPGDNILECYFSLKPVVGVANGSALSFKIFDMQESDGSRLPKNGSFPEAVPVGTVDAVTQPTVIITSLNGYMFANAIVMPPSSAGILGVYQITNLRMSGPAGARFVNIKLKNPYPDSTGMVFGYKNIWSSLSSPQNFSQNFNTFSKQSEYFILTLPNENNVIYSDGSTYNAYYISSNLYSSGSEVFYSHKYTPNRMGFQLTSKYDVVIVNSSGQVIDLSDVVVKHEDVVLQN